MRVALLLLALVAALIAAVGLGGKQLRRAEIVHRTAEIAAFRRGIDDRMLRVLPPEPVLLRTIHPPLLPELPPLTAISAELALSWVSSDDGSILTFKRITPATVIGPRYGGELTLRIGRGRALIPYTVRLVDDTRLVLETPGQQPLFAGEYSELADSYQMRLEIPGRDPTVLQIELPQQAPLRVSLVDPVRIGSALSNRLPAAFVLEIGPWRSARREAPPSPSVLGRAWCAVAGSCGEPLRLPIRPYAWIEVTPVQPMVASNLDLLGAGSAGPALVLTLMLGVWLALLKLRLMRLKNELAETLAITGSSDRSRVFSGSVGELERLTRHLKAEVRTYTQYLGTLAAKLSHELNTPLAIVRSSLDNLEQEEISESARSYAHRARTGADRLHQILRAMSEATRIERAVGQAEGEDFDLGSLIGGCVESYRTVEASRQFTLKLAASPTLIHGAPELIAQALDKLIDNARSFTPVGGRIELRLTRLRLGYRLEVDNEGPPLPARMTSQLFDQLVSIREQRTGGTHLGLGLHIVKLVAELHRGQASAANRPGGVIFTIDLLGMPRSRAARGTTSGAG